MSSVNLIQVKPQSVLVVALILASCVHALGAPAARVYKKPIDTLIAAAQSAVQQAKQNVTDDTASPDNRHRGVRFTSPVDGYFIQASFSSSGHNLNVCLESLARISTNLNFEQERASRGLPGPGQHKNFGALVPWDQILSKLNDGICSLAASCAQQSCRAL